MNTRSTLLSETRVSATFPSLFAMSGGIRYIWADSSDRAIYVYLPPPTLTTELRIAMVGDGSNAVTVRASSRAKINGSTTEVVTLTYPGDSLELVPNEDASSWATVNNVTIVR